ncbi:MAG: thioredoxin domain-containing protein, partial [Myxococcota bacterium]
SAGKAEVTFIRESIAEGRPVGELLLALRETVLVEVFADYNDPRLPKVWALAQAAARAYQQHRVVLRAPVVDDDAMRAVEFAECGRDTGLFSAWQGSLIEHAGAWDFNSLLELATAEGLNGDAVKACLSRIDIAAQVRKDRTHALERGLVRFPAVTVNRERVPIRDDALRKAIRAIIRSAST